MTDTYRLMYRSEAICQVCGITLMTCTSRSPMEFSGVKCYVDRSHPVKVEAEKIQMMEQT